MGRAMATEPLDVLQGTLEVLVLRALAGAPMHGYGVAQWLRQRTDEEAMQWRRYARAVARVLGPAQGEA